MRYPVNHVFLLLSLSLSVMSCGKNEDDVDWVKFVISAEQINSELHTYNVSSDALDYWNVTEPDHNPPARACFVTLQRKSDFNAEEFLSSGNTKNEGIKVFQEVMKSRWLNYDSLKDDAEVVLVYVDGPVQITCDHEFYGLPAGENLSAFFTMMWPGLAKRVTRIDGWYFEVVADRIPEERKTGLASTFFHEDEYIPFGFYIYPMPEIKEELNGLTINISIPVQKEMLLTYIKDFASGIPDATLQYEKDVLHTTIKY